MTKSANFGSRLLAKIKPDATNVIRIAVVSMICWPSLSWAQNDAGRIVKIEVKTTGGDFVDPDDILRIDMSKDKGAEGARVALNPTRTGKGRFEVWEKECKPYIRYEVTFRDNEVTRDPGGPVKCGELIIAINDVVFNSVNFLTQLSKAIDDKPWAQNLVMAAENRDYGTLAIAGAEYASQLRANGYRVQAEYFARISYEATVRGIAAKNPDLVAKLQTDPTKEAVTEAGERNVVRMTPAAKSLVEEFQRGKFNWTVDQQGFGETGWKTMRSLVKGNFAGTAQFELPEGAYEEIAAGGLKRAIAEFKPSGSSCIGCT